MVELVEKLDFLKEIGPYLQTKLQEEETADEENVQSNIVDIPTILNQCKPKIIGQERNGILLFTWFHPNSSAARKTIIELYDIASRNARQLFSHEKCMDIVSATVNEEQSLLAFTVRDAGRKQPSKSSVESNEIYRSFVAEIEPQYRVFSLNIEWHTYQKVNFLYGQYGSPKTSHMIFIHHKSSVGLYHIPVCHSGDGSWLMSSQPKTEQVIREFVWCQVDQTLQRLYYVQLVSQDEEDLNARGKFGAIEFQNNGTFKYVLEFYLPIQFRMDAMHQTVQYFNSYLGHTVSNMNFNMEVLTSSRNSFYICYQHPEELPPIIRTSQETSESSVTHDEVEDKTKVKYTVCCVHGGYSVNSVVIKTSSSKVPSQTSDRLFFTLFGDYVVVYVAGHFLHLLDCSSEHEPVHHLFLHDTDCPMIPDWDATLHEPILSISVKDVAPVVNLTSILFENKTQKLYKIELSQKKLCQIFFATNSPTKRLALLHAAVTHFRISNLTRKLIEIICQDPANSECTDLVKEYLLCSSYDEMKRQSPQNVCELKLLPFTSVDPFRGQMERDSSGDRVVHITYKTFSTDLVEVIQNQLRKHTLKFWVDIRAGLILVIDDQFHRFPYSQLSSSDIEIPEESTHIKAGDSRKSLFRRLSEATYRRGSVASTSNYRDKNADFLIYGAGGQDVDEETLLLDEGRRQHTIEKLNTHCNTCLPRESKTKIFSLCKSYADTRKKAVNTLWEIILKAYKYTSPYEIIRSILTVPGSRTDCSLFQMVERISYAVWELCFQSFPHMQTIALTLAYRCLPDHLFLQYVSDNVFQPTERFVHHFVADLPDDTEQHVALKVQLISQLPRDRSKSILQAWNHPIAKSYIAQQVMQLYNEDDSSPFGGMSKLPGCENKFLPLSILLQSLDVQANGPAAAAKGEVNKGDSKVDIDFIEGTALTETKRLRRLFESVGPADS